MPTHDSPNPRKNRYKLAKPVAFSSSRPDAARLRAHYTALTKAFETAQTKHDRVQRLLEKEPDASEKLTHKRQKTLKAQKRAMTEAIGELNATNAILNKKGWHLLRGFEKGTGFDQVWKDGNKKLIVVEAKGPGAKLGQSDRKGAQMSRSWVEMTARSMKDDHGIGEALEGHTTKVKGYVITSTPTGNRAKAEWEKFRYN